MVNKNIITAVAGVIGVAILVFILRPTIVVQPAPVTVVSQDGKGIGAVASPDIQSPYLSVGGLKSNFYRSDFNQATSTYCAYELPAGTTTLSFFKANITRGMADSATYNVILATSSKPYPIRGGGGLATTSGFIAAATFGTATVADTGVFSVGDTGSTTGQYYGILNDSWTTSPLVISNATTTTQYLIFYLGQATSTTAAYVASVNGACIARTESF